jgi:hypothetical protein
LEDEAAAAYELELSVVGAALRLCLVLHAGDRIPHHRVPVVTHGDARQEICVETSVTLFVLLFLNG